MPNLGGGEILIVLLVALLVLGPDKLPETMRHMGRARRQVADLQGRVKSEINSAMAGFDDPTNGDDRSGRSRKPDAEASGGPDPAMIARVDRAEAEARSGVMPVADPGT